MQILKKAFCRAQASKNPESFWESNRVFLELFVEHPGHSGVTFSFKRKGDK